MNSIDIIRAGRESYYTKLGKDDYYTDQRNPEGVFLGEGAFWLGLSGHTITKEDPRLKHLFQGLTPDGSKTLRQGMHTVREYYTLENPETRRTVQDSSPRVFYLQKDEVEAIRSGNPEEYSDRLRAFCKEHQHQFVDGTITPDWVQAQGKKKPRYTLQNPNTKEILHTQAPKVAYLNKFEVAQLRHGDPNQYTKRLTRLIEANRIDNPTEWVKLTTRRSVVAYDNVFSAPKDVSILWSLSPDEKTRQEVLSIHEHATRVAIEYLEEQAWVRRGKKGTQIEKADATFAVFTHTTSRDLDPQLHSHAVMLNFGITKEGKSGALNGKSILDARYAAGMMYQNELRRGLERRFGVATYDQPFQRSIGTSFGISGISQGIKNTFSKRTQAINQRINPGMSGKERRVEKLKSRKAKDHNVSTAALLKEWQAEGKAQGFSWRSVVGKARPQKPLTTKKDYKLLYREVTKQIYAKERTATISNHQVVAIVLSASRGRLESKQALKIASGIKEHF